MLYNSSRETSLVGSLDFPIGHLQIDYLTDPQTKLKLREEARAVFLQRKSRELIDNDELQKLWFTLEEHRTGEPVNNEGKGSFIAESFWYYFEQILRF